MRAGAAAGTKNTTVVGEARAGHEVPLARVFDVLAAFLDHDVTGVTSCGLRIPAAAVRQRTRLPFPVKHYDTPG